MLPCSFINIYLLEEETAAEYGQLLWGEIEKKKKCNSWGHNSYCLVIWRLMQYGIRLSSWHVVTFWFSYNICLVLYCIILPQACVQNPEHHKMNVHYYESLRCHTVQHAPHLPLEWMDMDIKESTLCMIWPEIKCEVSFPQPICC